MNRNELIPNKEYIGIDKDGNEYKCVLVNDYVPGGVIFSVFPAFTTNGEKNDLIDFKEVENV